STRPTRRAQGRIEKIVNKVAANAMALAATTRAFSICHPGLLWTESPRGTLVHSGSCASIGALFAVARGYGHQFDERMKCAGARNAAVRKMDTRVRASRCQPPVAHAPVADALLHE